MSITISEKSDPYFRPYLDDFNWDIVLSPENFPSTLEDGLQLVQKATWQLKKEVHTICYMPLEKRTLDNTMMAYHDAMIRFDAVERLIRSERLIHDDTPGKADLINQCTLVKEQTFSNKQLLSIFIGFASHMHRKNRLTPLKESYLKGMLCSMDDRHISANSVKKLARLKLSMREAPYAWYPGEFDSKKLQRENNEITFLTANLCIMPLFNSMIYGGLLPYTVRIDAICEQLKTINADVLFLQEVYDVRAITALFARLHPFYTDFYGNIPAQVCGFSHESLYANSGLAVISKFKLENIRFEPYLAITHDDKLSDYDRLKVFGYDRNYGILHCDVMNGNQTLAHIVSTHENPFHADIRAKQTLQIVESLQQQEYLHPGVPSILCGDLNIERGDLAEEGEQLIQKYFVDHYHEGGPTWFDFGNVWTQKWHGDNAERYLNMNPCPWTVDRSLLWAPWAKENDGYTMDVKRVPLHLSVDKPELALTDHHGVLTRFSYW